MNGLSLTENINIDINNLIKLTSLFSKLKDQTSFQELISSMRIVFREHLWRNLTVNSTEMTQKDSEKLNELGQNIKYIVQILGSFLC